MNTNLATLDTDFDPATLGWPASLPLEIALRTASPAAIREAYNLSLEEWEYLKGLPAFRQAVEDAVARTKEEGFSYRTKARMQAEGLLQTSWSMIHNTAVPPAVRADLIKFTARVAGYDSASKAGVDGGAGGSGFSININLAPPATAPRDDGTMTITMSPMDALPA